MSQQMVKKSDKFKHKLMIKKKKPLANSGIEGSLLNLVKCAYRKPTDYFELYGQLLKT